MDFMYVRMYYANLFATREGGPQRLQFLEKLFDGKTEDGTSYFEFISHINRQLGK